jgi:hypothetical protein
MFAETKVTAAIDTAAVPPIVPIPAITTLYALIGILQEQVVPENDALVTATVARLCNAGYVKFLNVSEDREIACTH